MLFVDVERERESTIQNKTSLSMIEIPNKGVPYLSKRAYKAQQNIGAFSVQEIPRRLVHSQLKALRFVASTSNSMAFSPRMQGNDGKSP